MRLNDGTSRASASQGRRVTPSILKPALISRISGTLQPPRETARVARGERGRLVRRRRHAPLDLRTHHMEDVGGGRLKPGVRIGSCISGAPSRADMAARHASLRHGPAAR